MIWCVSFTDYMFLRAWSEGRRGAPARGGRRDRFSRHLPLGCSAWPGRRRSIAFITSLGSAWNIIRWLWSRAMRSLAARQHQSRHFRDGYTRGDDRAKSGRSGSALLPSGCHDFRRGISLVIWSSAPRAINGDFCVTGRILGVAVVCAAWGQSGSLVRLDIK